VRCTVAAPTLANQSHRSLQQARAAPAWQHGTGSMAPPLSVRLRAGVAVAAQVILLHLSQSEPARAAPHAGTAHALDVGSEHHRVSVAGGEIGRLVAVHEESRKVSVLADIDGEDQGIGDRHPEHAAAGRRSALDWQFAHANATGHPDSTGTLAKRVREGARGRQAGQGRALPGSQNSHHSQ
jgi:hypothetical protein